MPVGRRSGAGRAPVGFLFRAYSEFINHGSKDIIYESFFCVTNIPKPKTWV